MRASLQRISTFLWFDDQAEDAVGFYTSVFENSRIGITLRYNKESAQASSRPEGSVLTIAFQLDGQDFTALNGGPVFKFNEAISLVVHCQSAAGACAYLGQRGTRAIVEISRGNQRTI